MKKVLLTTLMAVMSASLMAPQCGADQTTDQDVETRDDMNRALELRTAQADEIVQQIIAEHGADAMPEQKARQFIADFVGAHFERDIAE